MNWKHKQDAPQGDFDWLQEYCRNLLSLLLYTHLNLLLNNEHPLVLQDLQQYQVCTP